MKYDSDIKTDKSVYQKKDEIYLKQNDNKPYEFLNSFDLIYSEISNCIRNSLNNKLTEIESSAESQGKEILSLMVTAYDYKRELDILWNKANEINFNVDYKENCPNTRNNSYFLSNININNEACSEIKFNKNSNMSSRVPSNPAVGKICNSFERNSKNSKSDSLNSKISLLSENKTTSSEKENNILSYSINSNYFKGFFSQNFSESEKQKNSQPYFSINQHTVQRNINNSNNNKLNLIQNIKNNKSLKNNKENFHNEKIISKEFIKDNENQYDTLLFSYKKAKFSSEGNFSNSNTTTNTRGNSDKLESLFSKMNAKENIIQMTKTKSKPNIEKNPKEKELCNYKNVNNNLNPPRTSLTSTLNKHTKLQRDDKKPSKIIKKLFYDKKNVINPLDYEKHKNCVNFEHQDFQSISNHLDHVEHIQIDLFFSDSQTFGNNSNLFTFPKNENIILKLFEYCNSNKEKIKFKNISKLSRKIFFNNEIKILQNQIEYKKRDQNPLNKLKITNKDIFSKKFILSEIYANQLHHQGFRNFVCFIHIILFNEKSIQSMNSLVDNSTKLKDVIFEIETYKNEDNNLFSKYKEIFNNLRNRNDLFKILKENKNGKFYLEIIEFLKNNKDVEIFLELIESIKNLLEEDQKTNFEDIIDIEIMNHRLELLQFYKDKIS